MRTAEVELDSRQRLPLAKVIDGKHSRYRITYLEGGELLLTPVVSLTERELEMIGNPARMASIRAGIEQAQAGRVTAYRAGHFSKLLAEHGDDPFVPDEV
jgi:hypothetical protein